MYKLPQGTRNTKLEWSASQGHLCRPIVYKGTLSAKRDLALK